MNPLSGGKVETSWNGDIKSSLLGDQSTLSITGGQSRRVIASVMWRERKFDGSALYIRLPSADTEDTAEEPYVARRFILPNDGIYTTPRDNHILSRKGAKVLGWGRGLTRDADLCVRPCADLERHFCRASWGSSMSGMHTRPPDDASETNVAENRRPRRAHRVVLHRPSRCEFSGLSFYESVIKTAQLRMYVPPTSSNSARPGRRYRAVRGADHHRQFWRAHEDKALTLELEVENLKARCAGRRPSATTAPSSASIRSSTTRPTRGVRAFEPGRPHHILGHGAITTHRQSAAEVPSMTPATISFTLLRTQRDHGAASRHDRTACSGAKIEPISFKAPCRGSLREQLSAPRKYSHAR